MGPQHLQSDQDIEQILRIAVKLPNPNMELGLRDRLEAAANELGISPEQLAEAEKRYAEERALEEDMRAYIAEERSGFFWHLVPFVIVNAITMSTSLREGEFWFLFPLLGWGTGLIAHGMSVFNRKSEMFQRYFREWREKRQANRSAAT